MGNSAYTLTESKQIANNTIAQRFSANCGISCEKVVDGKRFEFKKGKNGPSGFSIEKKCAVSGDCMMESSLGAWTDIVFAAPDSSNAKEATLDEVAERLERLSRQEIGATLGQILLDECNIKSTTQISDVEFLTTDHKFDGPISIVQDKTLKSSCVISKALNASALAMATADNTATAGKDKKMDKGTSLLIVLLVIIGGGILSAVIFFRQRN